MFNLLNSITPTPQLIEDKGSSVKIGSTIKANCHLNYFGGGELFREAVLHLENKLSGMFFEGICEEAGYAINLSVNPDDKRFSKGNVKDSYIIDINEDSAELIGYDEGGVYYAAVSFSNLIHSENSSVLLPCCYIYDYPYSKTRGQFIECSSQTAFYTLDDWKNIIDYFAQTKINMVVVGIYGCWDRSLDGKFNENLLIPLKNHPEFETTYSIKYYSVAEKKWIYKTGVTPLMCKDDFLGDIIVYGKKRNVEIFPLFNSWGHNTVIPRIYPEVSAKNADGTPKCINLCTSNPKTLDMMFGIYDEIIDRYLTPNGIDSIHVGLDEVNEVIGFDINNLTEIRQPFCDCEVCRKKGVREIALEYVINLTKHLKSKGMKNVYMYHDMFAEHNMITEDTVRRFKDEDVYDAMVINWWGYGDIRDKFFGSEYAHITDCMRGVVMPETGLYCINIFIDKTQNIYDHKDLTLEMNFEGMLSYTAFDKSLDYAFDVFSECAWNPHKAEKERLLKKYAELKFPAAHSEVYNVITSAYEFTYAFHLANKCLEKLDHSTWNIRQLEGQEYPHDYPAKAYRAIAEDEKEFIPYLADIKAKSSAFYEFFDKLDSSDISQAWKLIFFAYKALTDEYLTIYTCTNSYNEYKVSAVDFANRLKQLVKQREDLMYLYEKSKIKGTMYAALRNMSIHRLTILSVLGVVEADIERGTHTNINLLKFREFALPELEYLR